jgi:hypothetical protein
VAAWGVRGGWVVHSRRARGAERGGSTHLLQLAVGQVAPAQLDPHAVLAVVCEQVQGFLRGPRQKAKSMTEKRGTERCLRVLFTTAPSHQRTEEGPSPPLPCQQQDSQALACSRRSPSLRAAGSTAGCAVLLLPPPPFFFFCGDVWGG